MLNLKYNTILIGVIILLIGLKAKSQVINDSLNFRNPVDIPLNLSGNFGEFRSNHFHMGIDIKTNGKIGIPIYAVADGWVRRVKISPFGYGKALYLDHPTGYTSVYAHLSSYNDTISSFLALAQEKLGKNQVDIFPNKNRLPVKKGDLVGYTGNSGRSGGPHLHFEIRTKDTEKPLNPLLLGFNIIDNRPPSIQGVLIEDLSNDQLRGKIDKTKRHYASSNKGEYKINGVIPVPEKFGISVHTLDYLTNSSNSFGVYKIEVFLDQKNIFETRFDSLDFSTNRYINAHKNYQVFKSEKSSFHRCFLMPNNKLEIYESVNKGLISLDDELVHDVKIIVSDAHGNSSILKFRIKKDQKNQGQISQSEDVFKFDQPNSLELDGFTVRMPGYRLINDEIIEASVYSKSKSKYSGTFKLGSDKIPVQNKYLISLELNDSLSIDSSKYYVARYNPNNGRFYNEGGEFKDGWIRTRVKQFGVFTILKDTSPPKISISSTLKSVKSKGKIYFKISDDLSGIDDYELMINGKWIPLYYNYKSSRLEGVVEVEAGLSKLDYLIKVRDERSNERILEGSLN